MDYSVTFLSYTGKRVKTMLVVVWNFFHFKVMYSCHSYYKWCSGENFKLNFSIKQMTSKANYKQAQTP